MLPSLLIHIRHGETDWNAARRLQGSQDIPLNATGRGQAARNGEALQVELERRGRRAEEFRFVSSPLGRSRETMEIVRRALGLVPETYDVDPRLIEVSFGRFEGMTYEDVEAQHPADYAALRADKWSFLPPGGENYHMLTDRVRAFLGEVNGDTIVVAHGGVFRALRAVVDGFDASLPELFVHQDRFYLWKNGQGGWI